MYRKVSFLVAVVLSFLTAFRVLPQMVSAAETAPMNLTFSPVSISLETDPGVPISKQIKIRNNSDQPEQLQVSLGSFTADASGEKPKLLEPSETLPFLSWLVVDQPNFTVLPGEWATLNLTFSPPPDAALGYYYAIYFRRSQAAFSPGATSVQGSPAVLALANVISPLAKRQLELTEFSAARNFTEFLPQTFNVTLKNTGNVHVVPNGNIFIDGQGKKDLAVLVLNPNNHTVLPQSSRTFTVTWDEGFPRRLIQGAEPATTTAPKLFGLEWDLAKADRFRFGNYTAHLLMVYDNGERDVPVESFTSFWVMPWKLILLGLIILSFVLVGVVSTLKTVRNLWQKKSPPEVS
jgi:hypothetical protein